MMVVLSEQAKKDMRWWRNYYRKAFPAGNAKASVHLAKAVELLSENAYLGSGIEGYNLRKYQIHRTPFALIYRVRDDEIEVARIWDGRKDPQKFHAKQ